MLTTFFNINTVAFTIWGYPLSYTELFGTIFNLWSVWLVARNRILTWPVGILGVIFFLILFYQIRLYSDTLEQVYYLGASVYGWWFWQSRDERTTAPIQLSPTSTLITSIIITIALSGILGWVTSRLHLWLSNLFVEAASFPYLDALTTVMSFTATILMARRRVECWVYWIIVDIIGIGLYYAKGINFIALLYVVFLILATQGLLAWQLTVQKRRSDAGTQVQAIP